MIVLIQCRDRVGLVAAISSYLSQLQINIVSMREHVDMSNQRFFARLELALQTSENPVEEKVLEEGLTLLLPSDSRVEVKQTRPKQVAVLVTKEHHCLSDLLIRHHFQTAGIEIKKVIGNYPALGDLCERFEVPFAYVTHEGKTKVQFEAEILTELEVRDWDFLVLAKFMRILSPEFVSRFPGRLMNIHHSFLPAFIGANPYRQAYERGVKMIGATAHFVTNDLDEGPIIAQQIIPVDHSYDAPAMMRSGKEIETSVLTRAVRLIAEDRVLVHANKTVVFE